MIRLKKTFQRCLVIFALLAFALAGTTAQSGKNKPTPPSAKPLKQCRQDKQTPPSPLIVMFNVLVTDTQGLSMADVAKDEFKIAENEAPQQLSIVDKREGPLSYGLLIDCSGSLRTQFKTVVSTAKALIETNAADDELFLVSFISHDQIKILEDWTSNRALLRKRVDELFIKGGPSAIVDAVYESARHLAEHLKLSSTPRRSALVVITDGEDRESYYKPETLIKLLTELKIQVFVIAFTQQVEPNSIREKATKFLLSLTQDTGGRAFFPTTPAELMEAVATIRHELVAQYQIVYEPTNQNRDNSVRTLSVEIETPGREKRLARARPSYVALCR